MLIIHSIVATFSLLLRTDIGKRNTKHDSPRVCGMLAVLAPAISGYDNGSPHSRLPPLGWSSWVALGPGAKHPIFDFCDEFSVLQSIDAFLEVGLHGAGYRHYHLDDCWAGGRNSSGFLYPDLGRFPNGMRKVVDYAHAKGLLFGLYTCAGTETCVGNRPGSKDHWTQDASVFAECGVDWVKMDWCNTQGMHPREAYGNMSAAMNATGRRMHLNMCEWGIDNPWEWGGKIAQSWRMSGDHTGVWSSTKRQVRLSASIPARYTGLPYGWNDMDMLETGNYDQAAHANGRESNMTYDEYHSEFSMWAISASPLVVTTPIMNCTTNMPTAGACNSTHEERNALCNDGKVRRQCECWPATSVTCKGWLSELQRSILLNREVLAINQDVTPQGRPVKEGDLRIWARDLSDGSIAVALYNEEDVAQSISVSFADLGWDASTHVSVRNLWSKVDEGKFVGRYPEGAGVTVAPHATRLLRLTKV